MTTTSNAYCAAVGIRAPRIEDAKSSPDANYYSLLLVALLERGEPMTLEDVAVAWGGVSDTGSSVNLGRGEPHGREASNHDVLVEGTVAEGPRVCGGIPLRPVKVSVLQELNLACNAMLPVEDGIAAPARTRTSGTPAAKPSPCTGKTKW